MSSDERIIELLAEMLHEQRGMREELSGVREELNGMREEQRYVRLELVKLNAKTDATIEAVDHLRESLVQVARAAGISADIYADHERRITHLETSARQK